MLKNFNKDRYSDLTTEIKKYKKFFITTYVAKQEIHQLYLKSIENYCKENNAMLLIMVADKKYEDINPELFDKYIFFFFDATSDKRRYRSRNKRHRKNDRC